MEAVERSGLARAELARRSGIDRSTLSQLLAETGDRLPRADTVASLANALQVSLDWLLGLSQNNTIGSEIISQSFEIEPSDRSPADEALERWHAEAAGYKIRYVAASLPDMLKTEEVMTYEYRDFHATSPAHAIERAYARLAYIRQPETEVEACTAVQAIDGLVRGEGIWRGLAADARRRQLRHMIELIEELYPRFRWFAFDGLARFSAPLTVFGPLRAAIYVGQMYFVFNATEHIRVLTRHFDDLIRQAHVQPHEMPAHLRRLVQDLPT